MDTKQLAQTALKTVNSASIPAAEAANVSAVQQWLFAIYEGKLDVIQCAHATGDGLELVQPAE